MIVLRNRPKNQVVWCRIINSVCVATSLAVVSFALNETNQVFLSGQIDWFLSSQPTPSDEIGSDEPLQNSAIQRLHQIENELENANSTFFMYDDPIISQITVRHIRKDVIWGRYHDEIEYDMKVLDLLYRSSRRRTNYTNVDIFVIPTPIGQSIASETLDEEVAIKALLTHPIFMSTNGNRHLLISTPFVTFRSSTIPHVRSISFYYGALDNVTVASSQDAALSKEACVHFKPFLQRYEFYGLELKGELCEDDRGYAVPPVRRYASIGLGHCSDDFPLVEPSMEKFFKSKYFILYRTRTAPSFSNSTIFRRFPIDNMDKDGFPLSTIGFDAPNRTVWVNEYSNAKFCLVIRGDTPNSHALLRSVRAGCLPIVISDTYPIFNPALQSSLDMDDFAFFIPEQSFLRDPKGELLKFAKLSRQTIYEKIQGVRLAQRILMPDHPQSLLVAALIKEVLASNQPEYLSTALNRAKAIMARNNITLADSES